MKMLTCHICNQTKTEYKFESSITCRDCRNKGRRARRKEAKDRFYSGGWKTAESTSRFYNHKDKEKAYAYLRFKDYSGFSIGEHRFLMMQQEDRILKSYEQVHHRDLTRDNNILSNLELSPGNHNFNQHVKSAITNVINENNKLKEEIEKLKEQLEQRTS